MGRRDVSVFCRKSCNRDNPLQSACRSNWSADRHGTNQGAVRASLRSSLRYRGEASGRNGTPLGTAAGEVGAVAGAPSGPRRCIHTFCSETRRVVIRRTRRLVLEGHLLRMAAVASPGPSARGGGGGGGDCEADRRFRLAALIAIIWLRRLRTRRRVVALGVEYYSSVDRRLPHYGANPELRWASDLVRTSRRPTRPRRAARRRR